MKKKLIKNIKHLVQVRDKDTIIVKGNDMAHLPIINDAWLAIENDLIVGYGAMSEWPGISDWSNLEVIDADKKIVLPTWCDAHTHIVFHNSRENEFVNRVKGLTYEQIAAQGGGILNSAKAMQIASEEVLFFTAQARINDMIALGTGAIEIKSGYGLSLESELKILRVIKQLKEKNTISIKATLLAAHAIPEIYKQNKEKYIQLIINEIIPEVAAQELADYCDVFCENNYFSPAETIRILEAGKNYGLIPKVHAEQLSHSGGIAAGVQVNAISVDHLEFANDDDITKLLASKTMPVILPGAAFFLNLPYPPARKMIERGLPLAIATDFNPGSSPTGNMNLMQSIACVQYKMLPEEVINASTINAAYAMGLQHTHGSITIGKKANLIITKEIPSVAFIPYSFGNNLIDRVIINGN